MSERDPERAKEVPARFHAEPAVGPVAKFMIVLCVLSVCIYAAVAAVPKVPMNPRFEEVDRLAQPVIEVIAKYRREHAREVPADLGELLRACQAAGMSGAALPSDPWGRALIWEPCDSTYHSPYVRSFGADGREGGAGENLDVSIWAGDP